MRLPVFLALSLLPSAPLSVSSQTFTGGGGTIPDNNTVVSFNLNVAGLSPAGLNTAFGLEQVCLTIQHSWDADLEVSLGAPDGTTVILFSGIGGDGDNFTGTCLRQDATTSVVTASAPFSGVYRPQYNLGNLNNGQSGNGQWRLRIRDMNAQDQGSLTGWSLTFGQQPAQPFSFTSSDLPILVMNTGGTVIPDDPKIPADLKIIYNGEGQRNHLTDTVYDFHGLIGVELRGSTSQGMPKKPYGFETWDAQHEDLKVSLLGMPKESDWTLIANYSDKSLVRNALTYALANKTGHYAPRTRFCEVVLNGEYRGVYLMTEKIKRDSARVNISKLKPEDIAGADVTGGYLIKVDKTTGSGGAGWYSAVAPPDASGGQRIYFQYAYPKPGDIQPEQAAYIRAFTDSFETALASAGFQDLGTGWRRYMDENSVIDYFLVNEMSRNVDGYRISTFLHKEKITKGNKLKMGPVWDYDIAWQNADYCAGQNVTGWAYDFNTVCGTDGSLVPFWWKRFRQDTLFNKRLYCRYTELRRGFLGTDSIHAQIDAMAARLNESQERNFTQWPIMGTYVWPNPAPIPTNYPGEIARLKNWVKDRLLWMDAQIDPYRTTAPAVDLGADTALCSGHSVPLHAGPAHSVVWSTGQTDTLIFAGTTGTYSVTLRSLYGCSASDTVRVTVNPLPDAAFTAAAQGNFTFVFGSVATGPVTYAWDFGDGTVSTGLNPIHTYTQPGGYTVTLTVTDAHGCTAVTSQTVQTQNLSVPEPAGVWIQVFPNPFTEGLMVRAARPGMEIRLVSTDGKTVYAGSHTGSEARIPLEALRPGLYVLRIVADGMDPAVYKVVKR